MKRNYSKVAIQYTYISSLQFPDTMDVLCLNYYRPHIVKEGKGPSLVEELFNFTMVDDHWPKSVFISSIVHYSQRRSSHTFFPSKPSINCPHNSCLSESVESPHGFDFIPEDLSPFWKD